MDNQGKIGRVNPISSLITFLTDKGFELNDLKASGHDMIEIEKVHKIIDGAIEFLRVHENLGEAFKNGEVKTE